MSYYRYHLFFCLNQKQGDKKCCAQSKAHLLCQYAKEQVKILGLQSSYGVRVSSSGCLGRCASGPCLVIYPEGIWYVCQDTKDIDNILQQHIQGGKVVTALLMDNPKL